MAIIKNESLESLLSRSINQGGVSFSLAGAKPNQTNFVGTSSVSGGLTANTGGTVTPREYFTATQGLQDKLLKDRDRTRNDQLMQGVKDTRTAFSDTMIARDQDNAQFKFAQDQARRSNAQNVINAGQANHASKVRAAQQWEAMSNQNQQAADNNRLENKKARFGLISNLSQVGAQRQQSQLQFEAAQLSDATNQKQIDSTERTTSQKTEADKEVGILDADAKKSAGTFGAFATAMNALAPQRYNYLSALG